ncbi:MAG: respiratory nitrate reductase subunit gamma [Nitrospiraceae bacterium]|nr:respiratory nitrate reductase subunit gamma [Nitrospiraceae bacterium]
MDIIGLIVNVVAYASALIFVTGIAVRFNNWLSVPNPLKIPTTPAPVTKTGTLIRVLSEVFVFRSLSKADKGLWLGGYVFHLSFLLVILRHLRYFLYPIPEWVLWFSNIGIYAGFTLVASLLYLLARRMLIDRVAYVSNVMDYFYLLLISLIGLTGLFMKYFARPQLIDIKNFILHLVAFDPIALPASMSIFFLIHLFLVLLLVAIFPLSKLMHAGGVFITPTRAMVNNARKVRHINPWADREWDKMVSAAGTGTDSYQPWSPEQWRGKWTK